MSMNVMDLLQGQLPDSLVEQLSQQIGGANPQQTATAASGVVNTLISALANNASSTEGANALTNALERDHDGSVVDNIMDILSGNAQPQNERALNGAGIINHILGDRQNNAMNMISQVSGLDQNKIGNLMMTLAPIVMGLLGRQKREQGLDANGIFDLLNGTVRQQQSSGNPLMDMATRFLDQDGDGSMVDDLLGGIGKKFLGNLFGGSR